MLDFSSVSQKIFEKIHQFLRKRFQLLNSYLLHNFLFLKIQDSCVNFLDYFEFQIPLQYFFLGKQNINHCKEG